VHNTPFILNNILSCIQNNLYVFDFIYFCLVEQHAP
jgi:hypothetical protein